MPVHSPLLFSAGRFAACIAIAIAALQASRAAAVEFPTQAIKLVVVYQAGGANDIVARVLADRMSTTIGQPVMVLVARKAFAAQSFAETMALERKKPGSVSMAVTASTYEFYHARINRLAQVDILKVPYSGVPAAMQDLNGDRVDLLIDTLAAQKPFIEAGTTKPLAVFGDRRLPELPQVPTLSELGLKGFNDQPYVGMLVPKATPQAAVQRLNQALNEALAQPEVKNRMQALGLTVAPGTSEAFLKEMKADSDRFVEVGLQAGIEKQQ